MKISFLILSTFLSFAVFDPQLFRRRWDGSHLSVIELSQSEGENELLAEQESQRHRLDVIPTGFRKIPPPVRSRCNYFSSKPRDMRYSDQRKIRRRINNM